MIENHDPTLKNILRSLRLAKILNIDRKALIRRSRNLGVKLCALDIAKFIFDPTCRLLVIFLARRTLKGLCINKKNIKISKIQFWAYSKPDGFWDCWAYQFAPGLARLIEERSASGKIVLIGNSGIIFVENPSFYPGFNWKYISRPRNICRKI